MEPSYKTFVSIGNGKQFFSRLLNMVDKNAHCLPKPILVQSGHTPFVSNQCSVVDFVNMDHFKKYMMEAEIVILHAGAGSVMHAIKMGKCPIVMPRMAKFDEVVNDHQVHFADVLHRQEKVFLINQAEELISAVQKVREKASCVQGDSSVSMAMDIIKNRLSNMLGSR